MLLYIIGMTSANATSTPYPIVNVESFLSNSTYFITTPAYSVVGSKTFTGNWQYTAIAYESDNVNITENATGGPTTFSTNALSNWGIWKDVNFGTTNIYFTDTTDGPTDVVFNLIRVNSPQLAAKSLFLIGAFDTP